MTKKCILVILLLCVSVYAQQKDNENAKDVETIPQATNEHPGASAPAPAPAQANELPGSEFSPVNPNYGKNNLKKIGMLLTRLVIF